MHALKGFVPVRGNYNGARVVGKNTGDRVFGLGIEAGSDFVDEKDPRPTNKRSGKDKARLLPTGESDPSLPDLAVETGPPVRFDAFEYPEKFVIRNRACPAEQVVSHGAMEQCGLLIHQRDALPERKIVNVMERNALAVIVEQLDRS